MNTYRLVNTYLRGWAEGSIGFYSRSGFVFHHVTRNVGGEPELAIYAKYWAVVGFAVLKIPMGLHNMMLLRQSGRARQL